ncbi:MAG: integration host factor subunit alpha [Deltaproteobacteria bacterium]|nr:integration host factor subunit alpha [Deltaproteobacteria bacterium]
MTLTKSAIVEDIAGLGFTKKRSEQLVEAVLEIIKNALQEGDDVLVSGFGKFCVKEKKRRRGRNPATGDVLILNERRVVTFKVSSVLKDRINEGI